MRIKPGVVINDDETFEQLSFGEAGGGFGPMADGHWICYSSGPADGGRYNFNCTGDADCPGNINGCHLPFEVTTGTNTFVLNIVTGDILLDPAEDSEYEKQDHLVIVTPVITGIHDRFNLFRVSLVDQKYTVSYNGKKIFEHILSEKEIAEIVAYKLSEPYV